MKKTNNLNKKAHEWIKNQLCYYHENYDIAEGYCDRGAAVILEGKYLCRKCATLKRKDKFQNLLLLLAPFFLWTGAFITYYCYLLFWPSVLLGIFAWIFTAASIVFAFSPFKHEGIIKDWNDFGCRHCPKKFLNKDKKLFAKHLKTEHPNEWNEIKEEIQQFPNNNKILKIEFPEILRKHKKEL